MIHREWSDTGLLSNAAYLSEVKSAVYVMRSLGCAGLFRSGVIGKNQQSNNAKKRLSQLNGGKQKEHTPWQFVFLAPLPQDMGSALTRAEIALQRALSEKFSTDRKGHFFTNDIDLVIDTASNAVDSVLEHEVTDANEILGQALREFIAAAPPHPAKEFQNQQRYFDLRYQALSALRTRFDVRIAQAILDHGLEGS
jgi:hypothetical protein